MPTMIPPPRPRGNASAASDDDGRLEAFRRYLAAIDGRDFREATRWARRLRRLGFSIVKLDQGRPGQ